MGKSGENNRRNYKEINKTMKKLIIFIAIVLVFSPVMGRAATVEELTAQTNTLVQQLITLLTQQIAILQQQLADMIAKQVEQTAVIQQQNQTIQAQGQTLGAIQQNTTPPPAEVVIVPEVKKEIQIIDEGGQSALSLFTFYLENGIKISGVPITVSADDGGLFAGVGGYFARVTQITEKMGYKDGKPGVLFYYIPSATGTRILSFEANGITTTIKTRGKLLEDFVK
jgi:hypothetical protein